jgi:hypothetical protein
MVGRFYDPSRRVEKFHWLVTSEDWWRSSLRTSLAKVRYTHPKDSIENAPVVYTRHAA